MYEFVGLKKPSDFQKVYKKRDSKANNLLVMYKIKNNLDCSRCGISVSKKVGNSVIRHRLKRQIREIFRLDEDICSGYDIIIVARVSAAGSSYKDLKSSFYNLIKRHGILNKS